jgi:hypothetical protein
MMVVQAYAAHVRAVVDEHNSVRLLKQPHQELLVNEQHRHRPTLVGSVPVGDTDERHFAELLHHLRRPRLQDRIGVVADQLIVVAHAFHARRKWRKGYRARSAHGSLRHRKSDEEIALFVRDERTGRFLFNDRAIQALGLDPIQLHQRGYPVCGPKTLNPPPD